jgi:hypothetical protein
VEQSLSSLGGPASGGAFAIVCKASVLVPSAWLVPVAGIAFGNQVLVEVKLEIQSALSSSKYDLCIVPCLGCHPNEQTDLAA